MTEDENKVAETVDGEPGLMFRLLGVTRDLAFAGFGLAGVLAEDAAALYHRSVQRGQDNVRQVQETLGLTGNLPGPRRPKSGHASRPAKRADLAHFTSEEWRAALNKLNVASPKDVEHLAAQVAQLEAKIDCMSNPSD